MAVSPKRGPRRGPGQTRRRLIQSARVDGTLVSIGWQAPFSEPVRTRSNVARFQGASPHVWYNIPFETVTPFGISTDVISNQPISSPTATPAADPFFEAWIQPFSLPTPPKRGLRPPYQQVFAPTDTDPVVSFSYYRPLEIPVRQKIGLKPYLQSTTAPTDTDPVVTFSYFNNLSDPVRTRRFNTALQNNAAIDSNFTPVTVTFTYFDFGALSEPVRTRSGLKAHLQRVTEITDTDPIVSFSYYNWLSEPVRLKPGLRIALQDPATPDTQTEFYLAFGYYSVLSEPVRQKPGLKTHLQSTVTADPQAEFPVSFGYYKQFTDPVRKYGLSVTNQQANWFVYFPVVVTDLGYISWWSNFSEPVRRIGLKTHLQSTTVTDPKPEFPISYGYYNPLSDPTRRTGIKTALGVEANWYVHYTPTMDHIAWWNNFSEPVRQKVGLKTHLQSTFTIDPQREFPISIAAWWQNFTDPVRKYGLRAGNQRADWWSDFTPTPPTDLGYISWWANFSEPTRRRGFRTEEQQSFASPHLQPTVTFGYYSPFSEPVRQKRGIRYTLQPVTVIPARQPNVTFGFYGWLSEPQRSRKFNVAEQQALIDTLYPITPPAVVTQGWFNWLDDPKRKRPGLSVTLQQAFTMPSRVILGGNITGTINAYQLNTDTAEISVFVRNYNVPTHAIVSIEEIAGGYNVARPHYLTSIQEVVIDEGRGKTSIIEED